MCISQGSILNEVPMDVCSVSADCKVTEGKEVVEMT